MPPRAPRSPPPPDHRGRRRAVGVHKEPGKVLAEGRTGRQGVRGPEDARPGPLPDEGEHLAGEDPRGLPQPSLNNRGPPGRRRIDLDRGEGPYLSRRGSGHLIIGREGLILGLDDDSGLLFCGRHRGGPPALPVEVRL